MTDNSTKLKTRSRWSWYFYDFGNSAYASIILLAVFSPYFKDVVVGGAEGTRLWGISVGIAAVAVALISPILGTIADFTKFKKKFLLAFTVLSVVFTALLFFVRKGDIFTGMLFFILAEIGYRASQVFYDALLADVSTPDTIGAISGKGWAMGMVGGIIALVLVIPIQLTGDINMTPYAFLIAAGFFMLSAIPTFLWVREIHEAEKLPENESVLVHAFKNLAKTFRSVKSYKEFIKYTISFLVYNDGIMMLMDFAAIIGATLFGLGMIELVMFVILIQITGALGALLFGRIADKKSGKIAVLYSLLVLILSIGALFFIPSHVQIWFFVVGAFAGFSLSGAQAVSRGMVVQLAPEEKTAEFYGFLSVAGRTSTFIGPLVFGTLSFRMHNWAVNNGIENAEEYGMLWGVGSILAFLLVGGLLLMFVKRIQVNGNSLEAGKEAD